MNVVFRYNCFQIIGAKRKSCLGTLCVSIFPLTGCLWQPIEAILLIFGTLIGHSAMIFLTKSEC